MVSYTEDQIITSDPAQLMAIKKAKEEFNLAQKIMPPNIRQIEEGKMSRLSQARNIAKLGKDAFDASHGSPKAILSLGKDLASIESIIAIAALFDLFALIPL